MEDPKIVFRNRRTIRGGEGTGAPAQKRKSEGGGGLILLPRKRASILLLRSQGKKRTLACFHFSSGRKVEKRMELFLILGAKRPFETLGNRGTGELNSLITQAEGQSRLVPIIHSGAKTSVKDFISLGVNDM